LGAVYVGTGSKEGQIMREEALKLISDGLERKLISVMEDLLSSSYPEQMVCLMSTRVFSE
jgi:nuclear pore complex protein Nup188